MTRILAYTDRLSARPGDSIQVKVSCDGIKQYNASLIRVIQGDINPAGPGYKEAIISNHLGGPFDGRYQAIAMGSYAIMEHVPNYDLNQSLGLQMLVNPTMPGQGIQTILSQIDTQQQTGFRLYLDEVGAATFEMTVNGAVERRACTDTPLISGMWYLVSVSINAENASLTLAQQPLSVYPQVTDANSVTCHYSAAISATNSVIIDAPILIAARMGSDQLKTEHFNGRIEAPRILSRALSSEEIQSLQTSTLENSIAAWDFAQGITTNEVFDVSGNDYHGRLVNLPTRGIAGHNWNGDEHNWQNKPEHYGAIHFHNDDLYDCEWDTDFELNVPDDLASGVYAIHLYDDNKEEFYLPIAIRPPRGKPSSKVAFLLPTASYMAYANNRIGIDVPETEIVCGQLLQMNPIDLFMQEHPELGLCFYDVHNDGSGVYYSSRLRPVVNMQPKHIGHLGGDGSNVWQFNADTHILDWLEQSGHTFDVITDEDLHHEGHESLTGYSTVITGTHPEYYSANMFDCLQDFLNDGGRLMYLGGNGFYWRVSFHPTLPGVIECRKSEDGIRAYPPKPGEFYASFTGEYTGLWRRNGRAPNELVGNGMVSQGFDYSSPYTLTEHSKNPRAAFVFEGVKGPEIGDYGLSGGGAAGLELDATDHALGTPPNTLILASSERHSDLYLMTPEDMNDPAPGLGGSEAEIIRAEMVFFETPGGGAVFSTGSIAWCGSLSHNEYQNDIARITSNVLNRFLDSAPFDDAQFFKEA